MGWPDSLSCPSWLAQERYAGNLSGVERSVYWGWWTLKGTSRCSSVEVRTSLAEVARRTGWTVRTIRRTLRSLEAKGFIKVDKERGMTSTVTLLSPDLWVKEHYPTQDSVSGVGLPPDRESGVPRTGSPGSTRSDIISVEDVKERKKEGASRPCSLPPEKIHQTWNLFAKKHDLPTLRKFSPAHASKFRARFKFWGKPWKAFWHDVDVACLAREASFWQHKRYPTFQQLFRSDDYFQQLIDTEHMRRSWADNGRNGRYEPDPSQMECYDEENRA